MKKNMKKIKTDDVSKIESKIYAFTDKLELKADDRTYIENLVDDLVELVFDTISEK